MRILIITQDDPFYLPDNLDYLFSNLPKECQVVGTVVSAVSPFGKKESFLQKAMRTLRIFGIRFFIRYGVDFLISRLPFRKTVRKVLEKHGIPEISITQSLNSAASLETLRHYDPDLIISIAGNEIFKKPLIELAPKGCLNLHTALLPRYRGLMPTFWVLRNKEKETGVSVFFVDEGIDSGPILLQERIQIGKMTQRELIKATKRLAMDAALRAIEMIRDGNIATLPNEDSESTYFTFPTKEDVKSFRQAGARFF